MEGDHGERRVLWRPDGARVARAHLTAFAAAAGRPGPYAELWRWSVSELEEFWSTVWDHFGVGGSYERVLGRRAMPGAEWFPGAEVNYAAHAFRDRDPAAVAIRHASELRGLQEMSWGELREQTARIRSGLVARGVGRGDRVAAYLPNLPETVAAFLATASLGAIWSSAAPEFGARAVIDRFAQIEPTVLLAVDGYRYGGRDHDRREAARAIADAVGARLISFGHLRGTSWEEGFLGEPSLEFESVPFAHPLWILYSSGTSGPPKAIVQSQGGILLEHLKALSLHLDLHAEDRLFWFTTTGWMMWNFLVGALLGPSSIVCYDGSPAGATLWDVAAASATTVLGVSAGFVAAAMKDGLDPHAGRDLSALHAVGSTGSPLSPEGFEWVYDHIGADTWLFSMSGGSDVCSAFVGGVPTLPVRRGRLQARSLGCAVEAFDERGRALSGAVGELVITEPMPSMPIGFWGDADGRRYREAYFDTYPGVWRHGDWIEIAADGSAVISGRSDATINRGGVRIGTAEIYRAVLLVDEVVDALVVDLDGFVPLFVVLRDGATLDDALTARIRRAVREDCSPRHVPDVVEQIDRIPRTLSGKSLEIPVKRILMGAAPDAVVSRESLADPAALDAFAALVPRLGASGSLRTGSESPRSG